MVSRKVLEAGQIITVKDSTYGEPFHDRSSSLCLILLPSKHRLIFLQGHELLLVEWLYRRERTYRGASFNRSGPSKAS